MTTPARPFPSQRILLGPGPRGQPPGDDNTLRLTWQRVAGTATTQAASALVHVIVLAQALPFADRWLVMSRCLGLR